VVGAPCWVVVMLRDFGSKFPCMLCGVFGLRGIQDFLKMWNYRLWTCVEMCLICYMFGSRRIARVVVCLLSFYIHILLFPLIRGTFVYFLCICVAPPALFIEFYYLSIKRIPIHKINSILFSSSILPHAAYSMVLIWYKEFSSLSLPSWYVQGFEVVFWYLHMGFGRFPSKNLYSLWQSFNLTTHLSHFYLLALISSTARASTASIIA
jgi:hypothetical protein